MFKKSDHLANVFRLRFEINWIRFMFLNRQSSFTGIQMLTWVPNKRPSGMGTVFETSRVHTYTHQQKKEN